MKVDIIYPNDEIYGSYEAIFAVDILRASSMVCMLHYKGAEKIYYTDDLKSSFQLKDKLNALLAGEIKGDMPAGFDMGNSPYEVRDKDVSGRTIVHFTTNGTPLFKRTFGKGKVFLASFLNLNRIIHILKGRVCFVLAGTNGSIAAEDLFYAGYVLSYFTRSNCGKNSCNALFVHNRFKKDPLRQCARTQNGKNLVKIEKFNDIKICLENNYCPVLPELFCDEHGVFSALSEN